jgi:hypothetical protein
MADLGQNVAPGLVLEPPRRRDANVCIRRGHTRDIIV